MSTGSQKTLSRGQFSVQMLVAALVACAAMALAALFWWPLVRGGGLVAGDVYSYYLPQKAIYAEDLAHWQLPLWNDRAGHGYPIVGESQTGPFYPPNVLLYRLLPLNTGYNVNHLFHYLLAFVFTWLYARAIGLSRWASGLSALVYTYGWFPPRSCLEWAIIGGAWLPAALWCAERFFATRRSQFAIGLCAVLTLQLLAGHFNFSFLTLVTLIPYALLRLFFARQGLPQSTRARATVYLAITLAAVGFAFSLCAVQIAPTWELKQLSQRDTPGPEHKLAFGSIPVWYWSQMIRPWTWYALGTDRDAALDKAEAELGAPTNQVEAHLYFGLIPLVLAIGEILALFRTRDRVSLIWFILASLSLCYTTGWFLGVTQHIPGFNFFQGPGRYGAITTFGVGILAGKSLDRLRATGSLMLSLGVLVAFGAVMFMALSFTALAEQLNEVSGVLSVFHVGAFIVTDGFVSGLMLFGLVSVILAVVSQQLVRGPSRSLAADLGRWTLTACVLFTTAFDLWLVSRVVKYTQFVDDPPINHLAESPVRQILSQNGGTARVFAPGPNLPTVLGAAATPVYLTFGPAAYVDPKLKMPESSVPKSIDGKQIDWMQRAGVTHILSEEPLNPEKLPVKPVWSGFDPLLNPAWARFRKPLYLYELAGGRGRIAWEKSGPGQIAKITELRPSRVVAEVDSSDGGRLIFTDLMYPGWSVTVDGASSKALTFEGWLRAVDIPAGPHKVVWSYHPRSVYWGAAVSGITLLILAAIAHVCYWHPERLKFLDPAGSP